jgi:thiol-disulfide isomerase/thioredoxin
VIDYAGIFESADSYDQFLERYGKPLDLARWQAKEQSLYLTESQQAVLAGFTRQMNVLCLAGAWCGDCVDQCPILGRFAAESDKIDLRFVDRDDCPPELRDSLKVCGGNRVPVALFLSEEYQPTGMYGDRTLSKYRAMAQSLTGDACSTGLTMPAAPGTMDQLTTAVLAEWLAEFERNQLILRTSPRLRQKHAD